MTQETNHANAGPTDTQLTTTDKLEVALTPPADTPEEPDFLAGAKACDRFDPTCESCQ